MLYGLVGKNIDYSFSQKIHNLIGKYDYSILSMDEERFTSFMESRNFSGLNITIPYKIEAMKYCDILTPIAEQIGCINTMYFRNGKLVGDNTDYYGFIYNLIINHIDIDDMVIAILGTGATSRTVTAALHNGFPGKSPREIIYVSRDSTKGDSYTTIKSHKDINIIINTTPIGTSPDFIKCPLDIQQFENLKAVVDVVYNPLNSTLILEAKDMGIKAVNGLNMLVAQAVKSAELFSHHTFKEGTISDIYHKIYFDIANIVLIGMPGSGKTTTGITLSRLLNKDFYDTDQQIEKSVKDSCCNYILNKGEVEFRKVEATISKKLASITGSIIATGGGLILEPRAINYLRHNGFVVWITRPLDQLPSVHRPLSQGNDSLTCMAEKRYPIYEKYADICFNYNDDIKLLVEKIGGQNEENY